ncbi:unnamed protein product [Malus baccata var. baccata]
MDRDRKANTRCTWFTQIGYVHGIEEFSLIVKGLHKYIGSSSPLQSELRLIVQLLPILQQHE